MSGKGLAAIATLLVVAAIAMGTVYQVDEREKVIVRQFGEIIRSDAAPGLHLKIPFANEVLRFDARIQTLDAEPELYLIREKKNLVVDSFLKWRIRDVAKYYPTVSGLKSNAEARLAQRVNDSLRQEFGKRTVKEVVSGDRVQIMDVVRQAVDEEAASLGIEVIDVRLKRVDLDPEISETVYRRMDAERSRVAKDLRAKGAREAERIRATADRERQIIIANARRD
ncbi:MAG: protease modulator HflC, partial [Gammaproteobacteria bacterium]|nr:protease modulator HflC [Gammaproteobacteria bacterium]